MIQCKECEHCKAGPGGGMTFTCDPFGTIKEPECLTKWHLLRLAEHSQKLDRLVAAYEATVSMYRRLAPLQEKMFRHMEREIDETEEGDRWKYDEDDDLTGENGENEDDNPRHRH